MGGVRGTDRDLILACKAGRARAWDRLVAKYERLVFSIPRSYGLSREDAADVSQATFIALVGGLDSLTEESNVKAWLATVARRHTWRLMEKGRREGTGREDDLADIPWLLGYEKPSERWETIDWLDAGLSQLGESCRKLLTALYLDASEPTYAEVSRRLGMPVGSIGPTRARCLQRLRAILGDR
jgi:RNA polymerase sigma factor (sigma-70 family)